MTTTHPNVNEYFATFSSISKKIVQDCDVIKNSFGDDWDNFSTEEREQELWNNLVHPDISEKYSSYPQPEHMQDVFPRLKIECGEKIVIDFDNDEGWTWRDEHSGPFSWRSRSQQDLRLFDDDAPLTVDVRKASQSASSRGASRAPSTSSPLVFTPKTSIWQSPFLRGQGASELPSDTAEVFSRFGIGFGDSWSLADVLDESVSSEPSRGGSVGGGGSEREGGSVGGGSGTRTDSPAPSPQRRRPAPPPGGRSVAPSTPDDAASSRDAAYENRAVDCHEGGGRPPGDPPAGRRADASSVAAPLSIDVTDGGGRLGHVSPAYQADDEEHAWRTEPFSGPGEYEREMETFHKYFAEACDDLGGPPVTDQPRGLAPGVQGRERGGPAPAEEGTVSDDELTSDNLSVSQSVKSGYDFLDNW